MKVKITTESERETLKLANELAKSLKGGEVIALSGPLGSGKTTFVKGLAKGLGVKNRITSPTFIISKPYPRGKTKRFYHLDLYRLGDQRELDELGLDEIIADLNNITAIEWPKKSIAKLGRQTINIKLSPGPGPRQRIIEIC